MMKTTEVIQHIRNDLGGLVDNGQKTVELDVLDNYLTKIQRELKESPGTTELDNQQSLLEREYKTKQDIEMFRTVMEAGRDALRTIMIVNGAAAVSTLGFVGAVASNPEIKSLGAGSAIALLWFGIGVLVVAFGMGSRYLSQSLFFHERHKIGHGFNGITISSAITGYVFFGFGVYEAYRSIIEHFSL